MYEGSVAFIKNTQQRYASTLTCQDQSNNIALFICDILGLYKDNVTLFDYSNYAVLQRLLLTFDIATKNKTK